MVNSGVVKTFDMKKVSVTFNGVVFTDAAEGDVVTITYEDNFEFVEGADGSENRINKNKKGADVEINISQTSITNDLLTPIFLADQENNTGKGPLIIKDLNGTSLFSSTQAYIKKLPDITRGDSLGTNTWMFRAPQATIFVGSNL